MKDKLRHKGEQHLIYNLKKWVNKVAFDILNNISENVTLIQLMDSLGNVNHAISILGHWISDSNYKKVIIFTQELLGIIRSPSIGEEQVATFLSIFYAVRYIWAPVHI